MKVVVNSCYGGFGLSKEAILELYKRGSKAVKAVDPEKYYGTKDWKARHEASTWTEAVLFDGKILNDNSADEFRSDPVLVAVVEEMADKANGNCARLRITEVPDDVKWEIEEYDGKEWVSEVHQTW